MQIKLQEPAGVHQMKLQTCGDVKQWFASKARFIHDHRKQSNKCEQESVVLILVTRTTVSTQIYCFWKRAVSVEFEEHTLEFTDPDSKKTMNNSFHSVTYHTAKRKKTHTLFSLKNYSR